MDDKEKWEDIEEYNGYYQISNYGNVRSLDRDIKYKDMRIYNYKGDSKALVKTGNGYLCVSLSKESETLVFFVHRLVGKYESQHECARILGVDVRNISAVLKNKRKSCSGYYFEYVGV